jgi:two-component sensor histidine kinase
VTVPVPDSPALLPKVQFRRRRPRQKTGARLPVRRAFLWLLIAAMLPLLLLAIGRSTLQLQRSQDAARANLSQRAIETARWQSEVVRTTRAILVLLAEHPDVRSGGVLCDIALGKVAAGAAAISNVSRFGPDGTLSCSSKGALTQLSVADQPWWPVAHRPGRFFLTGPVWGRMSQRQVLIAILPMGREDGRFDGIVSASIDMDWMERSLRSGSLGPDALAMVIDGRGTILAGSRPASFAAVDTRIGAGNIGMITDSGGREWAYALAPLVRDFDGKPTLYIAYAVPEARLFSAAWFQAGFTLLQPLLAILIVSLVIWFGTNALILRWLRDLRHLAQSFSTGNYRARLPDMGGAPVEIRSLGAALYRMGRAADRRDRALRSAVTRQNLLAREVHHRVKNNLQIVMSLLSLHAGRATGTDRDIGLGMTRLRISTIALVHRLFYETGEQASISSTQLLGGVCTLLDQFLGKRQDITIHCDIADCDVELDTAIPLCMWLAEAAANAWLHAFPDGRAGTITVTLRFDGAEGVLDVIDDGIGFAADAGGRGRPTSRGLRILGSIARQLGGRSAHDSGPSGTSVQLRYPLRAPVAAI